MSGSPRWAYVAWKDFEDAVRSKLLWGIIALFTLFGAGGSYAITFLPDNFFGGAELTSDNAIIALQSSATWLIPVIAAFVGFAAIVGERESGSLRILLGLPASRFDVVMGKLLGRVSIVFVSILTGFGISAIVILATYDKFLPVNFIVFTVLTALLGLSYTSISIAISAAIKTRDKALGAIVGFIAFSIFLWDFVPLGIYYLLNNTFPVPGENYPPWFAFLERVFPGGAYSTLANKFMEFGEFSEQMQNPVTGVDTVPFYISDWFTVCILLFWIVVPPYLGYRRFKSTDLG